MSKISPQDIADKILNDPGEVAPFLNEIQRIGDALPSRINADPHNVERGFARLVLTLVELLRQLMERQAIHRMESGSLSDEQVEKLGQTFLMRQNRMSELKRTFQLTDEDLNLDLGPLGKLM